jgi:ABC-type nitrate/sulfonate/bicarbonate transport system substrate-binding protein
MLRRNGLAAGDYELVKVGGMAQRWEALRDGKQDATLLSTPFDIIADAQAFKRLGRVAEVIGPYQGNIAAAKRDWARAHQNEIIGFIRSYTAGIEWLYDKTNREDAVTILMANVPGLSRHLAQQAWEELLGRGAGFCRRAKVDEEGLRTVLKLRERYGEPRKSLNDPTKYYDPSYYDRAICV